MAVECETSRLAISTLSAEVRRHLNTIALLKQAKTADANEIAKQALDIIHLDAREDLLRGQVRILKKAQEVTAGANDIVSETKANLTKTAADEQTALLKKLHEEQLCSLRLAGENQRKALSKKEGEVTALTASLAAKTATLEALQLTSANQTLQNTQLREKVTGLEASEAKTRQAMEDREAKTREAMADQVAAVRKAGQDNVRLQGMQTQAVNNRAEQSQTQLLQVLSYSLASSAQAQMYQSKCSDAALSKAIDFQQSFHRSLAQTGVHSAPPAFQPGLLPVSGAATVPAVTQQLELQQPLGKQIASTAAGIP
jgi:hypothetical protein